MDKESIFFSCLIILIVFEAGYYLMNPASLWTLGAGAITGIAVAGILTGIVAGFNFASSGENIFGARLMFISATLFCILFRFDIGTYTDNASPLNIISGVLSFLTLTRTTQSIPIGIGLLYPNMYNIFVIPGDTSMVGIIGMVIVSIIILLMVISGMMIAAGNQG